MDNQSAKDILNRYYSGNCTEKERQMVEDWVLYGMDGSFDLSETELFEDLLDLRYRLEQDLAAQVKQVKYLSIKRWLPYVAAILIIAIFGTWMYWNRGEKEAKNSIAKNAVENIQPGGNHAMLTLPNGQTINLSSAQKGIVVGNGVKYADGTTVTPVLGAGNIGNSRNDNSNKNGANVQMLTLSTPKGGTYQITLPDGTKVWLNSASKLTYPAHFDKNMRVVVLDGEAYFEVSKRWIAQDAGVEGKGAATSVVNKKDLVHTVRLPFLVKTKQQTVQVLGTEFNISAYKDDQNIKTTLVEGRVAVTISNNAAASGSRPATVFLQPGEQSIVQDGKSLVKEVDVAAFVGWKEGYFIFNGTELHDAMKLLSRWYDVEVSYKGNLPKTPFYGKISRYNTLEEVLTILKEAKVNFRIIRNDKANKLIVMP